MCAFHELIPERNKLLMSHVVERKLKLMTAVAAENPLSVSSLSFLHVRIGWLSPGFIFGHLYDRVSPKHVVVVVQQLVEITISLQYIFHR